MFTTQGFLATRESEAQSVVGEGGETIDDDSVWSLAEKLGFPITVGTDLVVETVNIGDPIENHLFAMVELFGRR